MTLTTESGNQEILCFYDSKADKDHFELTLESKFGCLAMNKIPTENLPEIISTLTYFKELLTKTTGR